MQNDTFECAEGHIHECMNGSEFVGLYACRVQK